MGAWVTSLTREILKHPSPRFNLCHVSIIELLDTWSQMFREKCQVAARYAHNTPPVDRLKRPEVLRCGRFSHACQVTKLSVASKGTIQPDFGDTKRVGLGKTSELGDVGSSDRPRHRLRRMCPSKCSPTPSHTPPQPSMSCLL